jgi:hypothetical protein
VSIATALVAIKTANSTLNTLIGEKFRADALDQADTVPMVRFQVISRPRPDYTFARRPQLSSVRVQIDGYAATSALRTALRTALIDCFMPSTRLNGSYGGETILDIRIVNEREGIEMLNTNVKACRITLDLIVDMRES